MTAQFELIDYRDGKRITHTPYGIITSTQGGDTTVTIKGVSIQCGKSLAPLILKRGQVVRYG